MWIEDKGTLTKEFGAQQKHVNLQEHFLYKNYYHLFHWALALKYAIETKIFVEVRSVIFTCMWESEYYQMLQKTKYLSTCEVSYSILSVFLMTICKQLTNTIKENTTNTLVYPFCIFSWLGSPLPCDSKNSKNQTL